MAEIETGNSTFNRLRRQWVDILKFSDWEPFDQELLPILKLFNQIAGLVTHMSCASHPQEDYSDFYISFAYRKTGLRHLMNIFTELRNCFIDRWPTHGDQITPRLLVLSLGVRGHPVNGDPADLYWWNSACLSLQNLSLATPDNNPAYKTQFLKMLEDVLQAYIEDHPTCVG